MKRKRTKTKKRRTINQRGIHFQVLDAPRQRKASVTHDPKRVMCYDQSRLGTQSF